MESRVAGHIGWIEVIYGSMSSGKSEELIRRLRRAQIARQRVQVLQAKIDARASSDRIVSHSEQKYLGRPFEPMPELLAIAEDITKTHAICMRCGNPANYTQRLIDNPERVVVGAADIYEARCRRCFEPPRQP